MNAAVTPSVFIHRAKHCGILHVELPWWCEAEMEVPRGKAARLDRMILAPSTLGTPVLAKAFRVDINAATGRIGSIGRCYQAAMQSGIGLEAQNMAKSKGEVKIRLKSATGSFPGFRLRAEEASLQY